MDPLFLPVSSPDLLERSGPGRPAQLKKGGRKNVYLDAESLDVATTLGGGNISKGIRIALLQARTASEREKK